MAKSKKLEKNDEKIWYVMVQGVTEGPFTQNEMDERQKSKSFKDEDLIFRAGLAKWMPAQDYLGLKEIPLEATKGKKEKEEEGENSEVIALEDGKAKSKGVKKFQLTRKKALLYGATSLMALIVMVSLFHTKKTQPTPIIAAGGSGNKVQTQEGQTLPKQPAPSGAQAPFLKLKQISLGPQYLIETSLPEGTLLGVEILAAFGAILKYPSFQLNKKVAVKKSQMPVIDLTKENLPSGDYFVLVSGGGLNASLPVAFGVHDQVFHKKMAEHKALLANQKKSELKLLNNNTKKLSRMLIDITKAYQMAHHKPSTKSKKIWNKKVIAWRKDIQKELKSVNGISETKRQIYIYPTQLLQLKFLDQKFTSIIKDFDQKMKSKRYPASGDDVTNSFKRELGKLAHSIQNLK